MARRNASTVVATDFGDAHKVEAFDDPARRRALV
jgi:hypothetical protein